MEDNGPQGNGIDHLVVLSDVDGHVGVSQKVGGSFSREESSVFVISERDGFKIGGFQGFPLLNIGLDGGRPGCRNEAVPAH